MNQIDKIDQTTKINDISDLKIDDIILITILEGDDEKYYKYLYTVQEGSNYRNTTIIAKIINIDKSQIKGHNIRTLVISSSNQNYITNNSILVISTDLDNFHYISFNNITKLS